MPLDTEAENADGDGSDDNEGPHCRNCHTGANTCEQCHGATGGAYTTTIDAAVAGRSNFTPQTNYRASAVANAISGQCLDGGFSFPHRTLGKDMLKDELYGVDFDGSVIAAGEVRDAVALGTMTNQYLTENNAATSIVPAVQNDVPGLAGQAAENLDSVCIDCHGDATYWNGDNAALEREMMLKGLP